MMRDLVLMIHPQTVLTSAKGISMGNWFCFVTRVKDCVDGKWYCCFTLGNVGGNIKGNGAGIINIAINFGNVERGGLTSRVWVWWKGMWFDSCSGGGTRCWLGLWRVDGFQKGSSILSFARSNTISDDWLHSVGAGDEPKGMWRRATTRPQMMAMQAATMDP
eukprot:1387505-Ditylum_brightwellii.AAC.1